MLNSLQKSIYLHVSLLLNMCQVVHKKTAQKTDPIGVP
ncbi:hypothetical protein L289_0455 [Acinetobacter gerneri DSM 14967 = CIP 107464 = MTCC 9824]|nr:hypothetical protein L289_0455 [Acinetobacter gerneri DSM 14967 = CIP 107464 = MTCC 9824]